MIKKILISNFRGHSRQLEFGPGVNFISGPNEGGKSTIKEALAFAFYGTDSEGSKNPDHLITVNESYAEVSVQTPKSTISRRKKLGATSEIKITRDNMPPVKLSQTDLSNQIKLSLEVFMSCWNAGYFMKLNQASKLKALGEVAKIDRPSLLRSLLPESIKIPVGVKYANPSVDKTAVATMRRQIQNTLSADETNLSQIEAQLSSMQGGSGKNVDAINAELAKVSALLTEWDLYTKASMNYRMKQSQIEVARQKKSEAEAEISRLQKMLEEIKSSAESEQKWVDVIKESLAKDEVDLSALPALRSVELPVPQKPRLGQEGSVCNVCSQPISSEHNSKVMGQYEKELVDYNKHESDVAQFNRPIQEAKGELAIKINVSQKQLADATSKLNSLRSSYQAKLAEIEVYKKVAAQEVIDEEIKAPSVPEGNAEDLKSRQAQLFGEIHSAKMFATQVETFNQRKADIAVSIESKKKEIADLALIEDALAKLPEVETYETLKSIKIPGVNISLIDGELVVKNDAGVDYRCLSDGRRMKLDVAICYSLQQASGPTAPKWIFVDNADLMDSRFSLPTGTQIFVAKVDDSIDGVVVTQM